MSAHVLINLLNQLRKMCLLSKYVRFYLSYDNKSTLYLKYKSVP